MIKDVIMSKTIGRSESKEPESMRLARHARQVPFDIRQELVRGLYLTEKGQPMIAERPIRTRNREDQRSFSAKANLRIVDISAIG